MEDLQNKKKLNYVKAALAAVGAVAVASAAVFALAYSSGSSSSANERESTQFPGSRYEFSIQATNLISHLNAFQTHADENNGNRSPKYGYDASADYVESQLEGTGLEVSRQYFEVEFIENTANELVILGENGEKIPQDFMVDYREMLYSGSGNYTAPVYNVPNLGCDQSDFDDMPDGSIALVKAGTCYNDYKVNFARVAGALATLVINHYGEDLYLTYANYEHDPLEDHPALFLASSLGDMLYEMGKTQQVTVQMASINIYSYINTSNIIAETPGGSEDAVIVVGAHLDSVVQGPGIDDNGSGSAAVIELATQFLKYAFAANKVKFVLWGAEEIGLYGSYHYLETLSDEELAKTAVYINLDMIASPNGFRGVHEANDPDNVPASTRNGSIYVQELYEQYYKSNKLEYELTPFIAASDYYYFQLFEVPTAGIFSGADEILTAEQKEKYGGVAHAKADPCYHTACDDNANYRADFLVENTKSTASVVEKLAKDTNLREIMERPDLTSPAPAKRSTATLPRHQSGFKGAAAPRRIIK